jgi:hypothetical protein
MLKLTDEQKLLLKWMLTGRTFKMCSDYGPDQGKIIPQKRLPVRVFAITVKKLYQAGLITFNPVIYFGQRWDDFSLTKKGKEVACSIA